MRPRRQPDADGSTVSGDGGLVQALLDIAPPGLVATMRRWYTLPALSCWMVADAVTGSLPLGGAPQGAVEPYAAMVPYSKWHSPGCAS